MARTVPRPGLGFPGVTPEMVLQDIAHMQHQIRMYFWMWVSALAIPLLFGVAVLVKWWLS